MFDVCGRRFSVKTVAMLAISMITRLQAIHERDMIYRDIKPDNFLIGKPGTPSENEVFVVDFGMAKAYRDKTSKQHNPYRERKSLSGTARYMSINTHMGREQSRRDDLEALGHVLMYFLRGQLPWQGIKAGNNRQKYEKIGEKKQTTGIRSLCEGFPSNVLFDPAMWNYFLTYLFIDQFVKYMQYSRKLRYEETPDYDWLRKLFQDVLREMDEPDDGVYDWQLLNEGKGGWHSLVEDKRFVRSRKLLMAPPREQKKAQKTREQVHETSKDSGNSNGWARFKTLMTCGML
ncbi:unnamed protein product [Mucor hiemalis]